MEMARIKKKRKTRKTRRRRRARRRRTRRAVTHGTMTGYFLRPYALVA
jgi:hypothetical protein